MVNKELSETTELMVSSDYKDRFVAEYIQLNTRLKKLEKLISDYVTGNLDFVPTCDINILQAQADAMHIYERILIYRAELEGIKL